MPLSPFPSIKLLYLSVSLYEGAWASHASVPPPTHPPHFGMPVPGICSNSSHPVGIGMYPLPPIPLSSLQLVSVHLMYASTCMKQPTWTPHHQHGAYTFYWLVTTKSFPSCSASWSWQTHSCGLHNGPAKNNSVDNRQLWVAFDNCWKTHLFCVRA